MNASGRNTRQSDNSPMQLEIMARHAKPVMSGCFLFIRAKTLSFMKSPATYAISEAAVILGVLPSTALNAS